MDERKIYIKGAAARQKGKLLLLSFNTDALIAFIGQHTNEKGRLNLKIVERREPGKYGETHDILLDTFVPTPRATQTGPAHIDDDSIPF